MDDHDDAQSAGLQWTGHPLPDMGIAALLVHARKEAPEEVTVGNLEDFAHDAERWYFSKALSGFITVLFTSNLINPSFKEERKQQFAGELLRSYQQPPQNGAPPCVYCDRPSVRQADRTLIPLLSGRTQINFYPGGDPSLGICGLCIVALQALSIGAPFCEGKAVIVEVGDRAADRKVLRAVAEARFQVLNTLLSLQTTEKPANIRGPRTRVIEALMSLQPVQAADEDGEESAEQAGPLTVYHLSNSGQGPGIEIYPLPSNVVRFVQRAQGQRYRGVWNRIVRRAWEGKRKEGEEPSEEEQRTLRNRFYDALFTLPDRAAVFVRRWLSWRLEGIAELGPTALEGQERWPLVTMFLMEVLGMEQLRISAIRALADKVAVDITDTNDRQIFRRFFGGRVDYRTVRDSLLRADRRHVQRLGEPLLTLDDFLVIFEEGEELVRTDWRLAWDLFRIRMVEELCRLEWFKRPEGQESMKAVDQEDADEEAEQEATLA